MAKPKPNHPPVHRSDLLASNMTAGKEAAVREMLSAYRAGAIMLGCEQWRLFFEIGRFNKHFDQDKKTYAAVIGAANRVQMCRYQVVGALQSWGSNRANEFRDTVVRSSLPPETKHMLHVVNKAKAWFRRDDMVMPKTGEVIPDGVRRLARSIMRHVMSRHRRPNLSRISMRLDHRAGTISRPVTADQKGRIGWWVRLSTMQKGRKIDVPLLTYDFHEQRPGRVTDGWCGNVMHADLNAARNIGERRALSIGSAFQGKAAILADLVRRFGERRVYSTRSGGRGSTADPRSSNPYFKEKDRRGSDVAETQSSQDLVAA